MTNSVDSQTYMNLTTPHEASCIKCGIPMGRFIPNKDYWCGNCGLVVYKNIFGKYKMGSLKNNG